MYTTPGGRNAVAGASDPADHPRPGAKVRTHHA